MDTNIKLAKLSTPRHIKYYKRTRLFNVLDQARQCPLIWIAGPAGSGKTVLVSSYLSERNLRPLWYQIDEGDNDIASFFYHLVLMLKEFDSYASKSLPLYTPEYQQNLITFSRNFFRKFFSYLPAGMVLVFDNYQHLPPDSSVHSAINLLIEEKPEGVNNIVISRSQAHEKFSRLIASGNLCSIAWDELRLQPDEMGEFSLCITDKSPDEKDLFAIYEQTKGWISGLVLMLKNSDSLHLHQGNSSSNHKQIFDYFAHEVFSGLSRETQEFLLKTALLPVLNIELSKKVSGQVDAENILSSLVFEQFFTIPLSVQSTGYEYHPLFREFLLQKGEQELDESTRYEIQKQAAIHLIREKQYDIAAKLLIAIKAHELLEQLIMDCSPQLLKQGRFQPLKQWLDALPAETFENPWMKYWRANVFLAINPSQARIDFEQALLAFEKNQQVDGIFLSWAGIIDSYVFVWDDFRPLDKWIAYMESRLKETPDFPSPLIETRVVFGMFLSLMFRQPHHSDMAVWANKIDLMIDQLPDDNRRIGMAAYYLHFLAMNGELSRASMVLERLKPVATQEKIEAVNLIPWQQSEAIYYWLNADFENSQKAIETGLELGKSSGVHLWDFVLLAQSAYVGFEMDDPKNRPFYLQQIRNIMDETGKLQQSHYYYIAALEAQLSRDPVRALTHISKALSNCEKLGMPFPESLSRIAMARILIELDKPEQARQELENATEVARKNNSYFVQFNVDLTWAELALKIDDKSLLVSSLTKAMSIGCSHNYFNTDYWRPYAMVALATVALTHNIEIDYVQKLIRRRHLIPDAPPLNIPHWPWEIQIYSLGRLSFLLEGKTLAADDKGKNKPLQMLKVLVALGGREVSEEKISEALWPDADGDVAHSAFTTNLSRLRKMLSREALLMKDGCLSLNDRLCWLDTWALERQIGNLEKLLSQSNCDDKDIHTMSQSILALYKGRFLAQQTQMSWMLGQRERLRLKFLHVLKRLINYYEQQGLYQHNISLYQKALELDAISEEFYRGLMQAYARQGEAAEALAVYKHCCQVLLEQFNMQPSSRTEQLYQKIKSQFNIQSLPI